VDIALVVKRLKLGSLGSIMLDAMSVTVVKQSLMFMKAQNPSLRYRKLNVRFALKHGVL